MKALLKYGLCLSLGLAPAMAFAQELQWRPAGRPVPAGTTSVGLSRPIPLDGPAQGMASTGIPVLQPIVRAQSPEDSKPLPPGPLGPLGGPAISKSTPLGPVVIDQAPINPTPKNGNFIAPPPQATKPGTIVSSTPLGGDACGDVCGNSCGNPCGTACWGAGILGGHGIFSQACGANPCNPCDPCVRPRCWGFIDYLLWVPQGQSLPPLVTVSPAGTPFASTGVLGSPSTGVLFNGFNNNALSGVRVGGGFWFHECGNWGMDTSYWSLLPHSQTFTAGGNGNPNIGRPFFSVTDGTQKAEIVAFPFPPVGSANGLGAADGTISVREYQNLWGAEIDLRRKLCCGPNGWVDLLMGYRHFSLSEGIDVTENIVPLDVNGNPFGTNVVSDRFHTTNKFNGAQVGLAGQWNFLPRWSLTTNARVALGDVHQVVDIQGNQIFNIPPIPGSIQQGGLLALPSSIGSRSTDRFAVMPEIGLKLGYNLTPNLRVYAGYDFMLISSVVRPGSQIDLNVNRTQVPNIFGPQALVGPAFPAPQFNTSSFWVQGINFGMQYRY
jgi:hypothetical protein